MVVQQKMNLFPGFIHIFSCITDISGGLCMQMSKIILECGGSRRGKGKVNNAENIFQTDLKL